ncbi:MAG: hypothetical protein NVSMB25_24200 [Thermoleophilaceae bacterium]
MSSSALARAVFGLLVLSTVGAFFVTQRLKRSAPPVKRIVVPRYVTPRGGPKRRAHLRFTLPKADYVTVSIVDRNDDEVRRLADDVALPRGVHRFVWSGRDRSGRVPAEGLYFMRIVLHGQGRAVTSPRGMQLVTRPPAVRLVSVTPDTLSPGAAGPVSIRFAGPTNSPARVTVYRTDLPRPVVVARLDAPAGSGTATWDVRTGGLPAPPGLYAFAVTVRNRALVAGSAPARLPPDARSAAPATGLTITPPTIAGPLEPVAAGAHVGLRVGVTTGRLRYTLTRLGSRRALGRGIGVAPNVSVAVPARASTGLYTVAVGGAAFPLAVRARRVGPVLVVLPALAWQGLNPIDDDRNGFENTLDNSSSVALSRPLAHGRDPAGLRAQVEPLLRFADRRRLRYDLTTDEALARGLGPALRGHRGVIFAGSERWTPAALQADLRRYVASGGRVASFASDSFHRTVALDGGHLSAPGRRRAQDAFGERTAFAASLRAPLVASLDQLGLFAGTNGAIGLFTSFEQSVAVPRGAALVAAAGRDPARPSLVAYRLGRGMVVRTGTSQWSAAIAGDRQVADVTAGLWSLLSR